MTIEYEDRAVCYFSEALRILDDSDELNKYGISYVRMLIDAADICLRLAKRDE